MSDYIIFILFVLFLVLMSAFTPSTSKSNQPQIIATASAAYEVTNPNGNIIGVVGGVDVDAFNIAYDIVTSKGVQCVYINRSNNSSLGGLSCNWDAYNKENGE